MAAKADDSADVYVIGGMALIGLAAYFLLRPKTTAPPGGGGGGLPLSITAQSVSSPVGVRVGVSWVVRNLSTVPLETPIYIVAQITSNGAGLAFQPSVYYDFLSPTKVVVYAPNPIAVGASFSGAVLVEGTNPGNATIILQAQATSPAGVAQATAQVTIT